jgi:hypothetical protein
VNDGFIPAFRLGFVQIPVGGGDQIDQPAFLRRDGYGTAYAQGHVRCANGAAALDFKVLYHLAQSFADGG